MRALCLALLSCLPLLVFGQATPVVVADICPGGCSSNPSNLVEWNGKVYFFATSPTAGRELHVYDGTSVSVVADINPGSGGSISPSTDLTMFGGKFYFAANDTAAATRYYLYSFDGSNAPQKVLVAGTPIPTFGSSGGVGSDLYFAYNDSADRTQFAKYTPSTNSVQVTPHSFGYKAGCPCDLAGVGGYVFFNRIYYPPGYGVRIPEMVHPNGSSLPPSTFFYASSAKPTVINDEAFFVAKVGFPGFYHVARFTTSPPSQNTIVQGGPSTHPPPGGEVAAYNGRVFFGSYSSPSTADSTRGLFQFDPASATTTPVATLPTSFSNFSSGLTLAKTVGNVFYFGYSSAATYTELYGYTQTTGVTQITNIDGQYAGFNPTAILSYNNDLLIAGTTSASGTELYRIAGTGLGLTDAQQSSAAILSPNPASTQLTITLPTSARHTLRILSTTGQTVGTHTLQGSSSAISIEDLAPGLYFAHITDATTGATSGTARFVKE